MAKEKTEKSEVKEDEAPTLATKVTPPDEPGAATSARRKRARPASSGTRSRAKSIPSLEERLAEFFGEIKQNEESGIVYCTGLAQLGWIYHPPDGFLIATNSPSMAKAWANLAESNERVERMLEAILSGGAWGGVVIATLPVCLGILANHGVAIGALGMGSPSAEPVGEQPPPSTNGRGLDGGYTTPPMVVVPPGFQG